MLVICQSKFITCLCWRTWMCGSCDRAGRSAVP